MQMMKRALALLLVLAMLMPNLTTIAQAADVEDIIPVTTESVVMEEETETPVKETEAPTKETEAPTKETEAPTKETEAPAEETEAPAEETEAPAKETEAPTEQPELPREFVEQILVVEDTVAPVSGYSNDDMFAMYVDRLLYPHRPFALGNAGLHNLDDKHLELYQRLADAAATLANYGGDSVITLSSEDLASMGFTTAMTAQELAGTDTVSEFTQEHEDTLLAAFALDLGPVLSALLTNLPYDLYWFDKTQSVPLSYGMSQAGYEQDGQIYLTKLQITNYTITLKVAPAYQDVSDTSVSTAAAEAAVSAKAVADSVVEANEGKSDYEKLVAYKDYICDAVSYNEEAADETYTGGYGNPWQMIHVFDEDSSTNVVCEGYAKAFQYLCDMSSFTAAECYLISGIADEPHMWNIVSIGGRSYMADITNTDPAGGNNISFGEDGAVFMTGASGSIADGYTFYNPKFDPSDLTYLYYYEVVNENGETETVSPAVDIYGAEEDSVLILSDMDYLDYVQQQEEQDQAQNALLESLAQDATLTQEAVVTKDATFNNLTVAEGGRLTIQGAAVTVSGDSCINAGTIELTEGAKLTVEGDLTVTGYYDENADEAHVGDLQVNEGTQLIIVGENSEETNGRISVQDCGYLFAAENTVSVPDGTIEIWYERGSENGVPKTAQKLTAFITDEQMLQTLAAELHTVREDGNVQLNYGGANICIQQNLTLYENITIYGGVEILLQNHNPEENNRVTLTVAECSTLTIQNCYLEVGEGTEISVEGTLNDFGFASIREGGRLICRESGKIRVLKNGELVNNDGDIYVSGQLITEEEGSDRGFLNGKEPVFTAPYLSFRWLDNWGNGWFDNPDNELHREVRLSPGEQFYMTAYLNQWNDNDCCWETSPVYANKLVTDGNLVLEPFNAINDGSSHVEDGQNPQCFFRLRGADGVMDVVSTLTYSNTDIQSEITIGRWYNGFYSEDPTASDKDVNSLWLNNFCVGGTERSFYFYFDPDLYHDEGWTATDLTVNREDLVTVTKETTPNLWKITFTEEAAKNIFAMREFRLEVNCEISKEDHDNRYEGAGIQCYAGDFGEPNATFNINGTRYHASWNYNGFFTFEGEDDDQYPVPAAVEGVSYDIHSNTLTLTNANLQSLHVNNYWRDDQTGEEGWDLPQGQFTILLEGDNFIRATNDHALRVGNDMHLVITGDGSLKVSNHGDENNTCHSAFEAYDADVTIEGNARVIAEISGEGYEWTEDGPGKQAHMNAFRGIGEGRNLWLRQNASLTTIIPEGVCANGYFAEDGSFVEDCGFSGLEFFNIEINDEANLETQTIRVWDGGQGNAFGGYYQNGGTVHVTGIPYYNKDNQNENGTIGHYHFSGLEANYGRIEINGGTLNLEMTATKAQTDKSAYFHALQSRGSGIRLNGGQINVSSNFAGTGIKVGEDNWDDGANAWVDFNNCTLNMADSSLYRTAIEVAPSGRINFNGGRINARRANIQIRGHMDWNGTNLNAIECGLQIVHGGKAVLNGGWLNIKDGNLIIENQYDEQGNVLDSGILDMRGGYVELNNSFLRLAGCMRMESGAVIQSMDYRKLTTDAGFVQAFVIGHSGYLELCGDAYLEVTGMDKADGVYNEGAIRQHGGSLIVDVDENQMTAALFGPGQNRFEGGNAYLEGYNGLVQFNRPDYSELFVGGNAVVNAVGKQAGLITYAPAVFAGGNVYAHAACPVETVTDEQGNTRTIYPVAVLVQNDADDTNASLTISGGNHYFETFEKDKLVAGGRGLVLEKASFAFTGGALDVEAETAVYYAEDAETTFEVPVIISNETGGELTMAHSDALNAQTLLVGEKYARSVAFRTSQNCGENVRWNLTDGVLTISVIDSDKPGNMDDYHMPINDPASWRVAPWYTMRDTITKVVVEEGVEHVGDWAFGRLPEVTEIVYSSTVNRIDMTSNYDCPKLEKFTVAESNGTYSVSDEGKVLIENGSLVRAAVKSITSYKADDNIHTIGMGAFDSSALEELDLNQVQVIQNYAFADCVNLKSVYIPDGVATIDMTVFQNSGLEAISIPASVTKIRNYAFDGCAALADVEYRGNVNQWENILIGSGNMALTSVPVTFAGAAEEEQMGDGKAYLSYHLLHFGHQGYYEDMEAEKTSMTVPVGYYTPMVVYLNIWNDQAKKWDRHVVDPERLEGQDLEIGPFRYYEGIGIAEGEPNAYHFFELAATTGWGETKYLSHTMDDGTVATLPIQLTRSQVGFYSADPTNLAEDPDARNQLWLNYYLINPNVSGHSVYFALTEHPSDFASAPQVSSDRLTAEDLAKVQVEEINKSVYKITLPDEVAAKVYDYRGIPIQVHYEIAATETTQADEGTVDFTFGSVSFGGNCVTFGINDVWYESYEGLEGYFSWDEKNEKRIAYKEIPVESVGEGKASITYDAETDTITMTNAAIEKLHLQYRWYNEQTNESGTSLKDSNLKLKLVGKNIISNPGIESALYVGGGLELTITSTEEDNGSLEISATNAEATANSYSQNAVCVNDGASLVIEGHANVKTSIEKNDAMHEGWLMNMWGGGSNTLTIRDDATLTTKIPEGARANCDTEEFRGGFVGIDWFGQIRVQDRAELNTTKLNLSEYYDGENVYRGKGSYVQTGGTVTIEALGSMGGNGYHYDGLVIEGGSSARISGGTLNIQDNAAQVEADCLAEQYTGFCGIQNRGHLEIENAAVNIQMTEYGAGIGLEDSAAYIKEGAVIKFVGNGKSQNALEVRGGGNLQLQGGKVDVTDANIVLQSGGFMEIHGGTLSVVSANHPIQTRLSLHHDSRLVLHNGDIVVNKGMTGACDAAVSLNGHLELNGGTMTVTGNEGINVHDGELHQNGTELTVNGLESPMSASNGAIWLNGGNTLVTLGQENQIIDNWYSAVNLHEGSYMEVNDGFHRFQVLGAPSENSGYWLGALSVNSGMHVNGGTLELDTHEGSHAIFNRSKADHCTVGFNQDNAMGAISLEDGTAVNMYFCGEDETLGEQYYTLGADNQAVSDAVILHTVAGHESSWTIEKDGDKTILVINGNWDMYNYYMPEAEAEENWEKTPWYSYKDQITHVEIRDGINHIGDWVFARMSKLENVKIPASVHSISTSAFYDCPNLQNFTMQGNDNYFLDDATKLDENADDQGYYTGTVIIEGNWKVLKAAPSVTAYTVPRDISEIGNGAFQNCINFSSITFTTDENGWGNVGNIGNNAFENTALTKLELPDGVRSIGRNAFHNCGSL